MAELNVVIELTEEMLGSISPNPKLQEEWQLNQLKDPEKRKAELAANPNADLTEEELEQALKQTKTVFLRHNEKPCLFDFHIKGFLKATCVSLARVPDTYSNKLKARTKVMTTLVFPHPRIIMLEMPEGGVIGDCQRPAILSTPQGERSALLNSETVPAGTRLTFTIEYLDPGLKKLLLELLEYGELYGLGQWRNSGKGRFKVISCVDPEEVKK